MEDGGQQEPPEATSNETEDQFQLSATSNLTIPEGSAVNPTSLPAEAGPAQEQVAIAELTQQYPQAIGALVPFFMQPMLTQNSFPQSHQINPNNMQMMIHNLLQPSGSSSAAATTTGPPMTTNVSSSSNQNTDSLQASTSNQQALTENHQPVSMTAIQNLMRISSTTQQQATFPHFNMLQNLITSIPMQPQNLSAVTHLSDSSNQQGDASLMTSAAPTEDPDPQNTPKPQAAGTSMMLPSLNSTMGMINMSQTSAQPAYPFQSLLKMNTNPVTPTVPAGLWMTPQYPATFYGGMVLGAQPPPQYTLAQPNPLVMQNLFTQMATHQGATAAVTFPQTAGTLLSFNPADSMATASSSALGTNNHHHPVISADLPDNPQKDRTALPLPIYMEYDEETLTEYQCLLRKQIELFEAGPEDIKASAQGRNNPILLGQVGIRCRYCAALPLKSRPRGAVYYSKSIDGLYQVAQNMSKLHFCRTCKLIPKDTQQRLDHLQRVNRRAAGGKEYWAEGVRVLGVYEDGHVMRFRRSTTRRKDQDDDDDLETTREHHPLATTTPPDDSPPRLQQDVTTMIDTTTGLTDDDGDDDDDDDSTNTSP